MSAALRRDATNRQPDACIGRVRAWRRRPAEYARTDLDARWSLAGATPSLQVPWIVLAPAGPLAAATIEALRAAGAVAVLAEPGDRYEQRGAAAARLRHDSADDVAALVRDVTAAHGALRGIILLAPQAATGAEHGAAAARTYRVLVALAAGLDAWDAAAPITVLVVSAGARSVLGEPSPIRLPRCQPVRCWCCRRKRRGCVSAASILRSAASPATRRRPRASWSRRRLRTGQKTSLRGGTTAVG